MLLRWPSLVKLQKNHKHTLRTYTLWFPRKAVSATKSGKISWHSLCFRHNKRPEIRLILSRWNLTQQRRVPRSVENFFVEAPFFPKSDAQSTPRAFILWFGKKLFSVIYISIIKYKVLSTKLILHLSQTITPRNIKMQLQNCSRAHALIAHTICQMSEQRKGAEENLQPIRLQKVALHRKHYIIPHIRNQDGLVWLIHYFVHTLQREETHMRGYASPADNEPYMSRWHWIYTLGWNMRICRGRKDRKRTNMCISRLK